MGKAPDLRREKAHPVHHASGAKRANILSKGRNKGLAASQDDREEKQRHDNWRIIPDISFKQRDSAEHAEA